MMDVVPGRNLCLSWIFPLRMYVENARASRTVVLMLIDDLGVIAEVIECKSFKTKFAADSTQTYIPKNLLLILDR